MEEKLRNLSQNIENNTGENAHKPEENPPDQSAEPISASDREDTPVEENQEKHEDSTPWEEEEVSDYTPEPEEEHHEEESHDESKSEENGESVDVDFKPVKEQEEAEEEHHDEPEPKPEEEKEEPKEEPKEDDAPKILTMTEEEPKESPTRTKKYSPEVEAALNRLNAEEASVDFDTEPLSTEPKKKHHAGRVFLVILLLIAIAAITVCVLVEQKVIDNPLDWFTKKESSKVEPAPAPEPASEPTALTDETLIAAVNALLAKQITTDNYYVFARTYQKGIDNEYIYYDVAETPATDCATAAEQTDCADAVKITADNYKDFPQYRYSFKKTDFDVYEFEERTPFGSSEVIKEVSEKLNDNTEEKK